MIGREILRTLEPSEVLICKWPSPLRFKFYKNCLPGTPLVYCQSCWMVSVPIFILYSYVQCTYEDFEDYSFEITNSSSMRTTLLFSCCQLEPVRFVGPLFSRIIVRDLHCRPKRNMELQKSMYYILFSDL